MNSRKLLEREDKGVDQAVVPPESELEGTSFEVGNQMDLDVLTDGDSGHGDRGVVELDAAVGVDGSGLPQAEDVLG